MAAAPAGTERLFIGLMSGTSLDGVDGVLIDFAATPPRQLAHRYLAFDEATREQLASLCQPGADEVDRSGAAAQSLAASYAEVVAQLLAQAGVAADRVVAIGVHGQTIRHRPERGYTVQLNAPAALVERVGIPVVADFRSRDVAAGGQGAPLVSAFHAFAFSSSEARAVVNVGGISNVTFLPAQGDGIIGFDCGPGNVLMDSWTQRHFGEPFDRDGGLSAGVAVDSALLERLLADPYFEQAPPKSTGRELFTTQWLDRALARGDLDPRVVLATLTRLTAVGIGRAIRRWCPDSADVIICGGGAHNSALMRALYEECGGRPVRSSAALGIDPQCVEAQAFAWLAFAFAERRPGNIPGVTGARGPRILGALYPA